MSSQTQQICERTVWSILGVVLTVGSVLNLCSKNIRQPDVPERGAALYGPEVIVNQALQQYGLTLSDVDRFLRTTQEGVSLTRDWLIQGKRPDFSQLSPGVQVVLIKFLEDNGNLANMRQWYLREALKEVPKAIPVTYTEEGKPIPKAIAVE